MNAERRQRVLELLDATLAEPPKSRPAFLAEACGEDLELQRDVESLLELESEAEDFLPAPAVPRSATLEPEETLEEGNRIGPYRIIELLGRGGMGAVYLAVREDDFEKHVALKLLQRDLVSEATVRRFHNERQILARLEHPLIARLLDGGTTEDGRPFLVMEYVEGVPIDEYCDELKLSVRKRLGLFLKVCSALAFAHQNLVVHRDLKPSNILITDDGVPKLLDFGIAKLLPSEEESPRGDLTHLGEQPMTPRYASPEQVRRQPITTASDIHALGALLYRLLTGRLPCRLESCPFAEVSWRIVDEEAVKPSLAVVRTETVATGKGRRTWTPESVSLTRDGDPEKLRRALAGDVDAVLLKALRKEPAARYASVDQLADDLRRHLTGLPVAARKGTFIYRGDKYLRRHKWWLTAALFSVLALAAFFVRERQRLEAERQHAERVTSVLRGLVRLAEPDRRDDASVIQSLEEVRDRLADLEADRDLRAALLTTLSTVYYRLGKTDTAFELARESLDLWRQQNPDDLMGLAARINNVAAVYGRQGDYGPAEAFLREALELRDRLGDESSRMVVNLNNLASILLARGAFDEAETLYRRGLDIRERTVGRDDPDFSKSLRSLGALLYSRGDFAAAEPMVREALEIRERAYSREHTEVASVLDLLGRIRFARDDREEAADLIGRALDIRENRLAEDHVDVAWSRRNLGLVLLAQGELATARVLLGRAHDVLRLALPEEHPRHAAASSDLGALLMAEGRYSEAEPCLLEGYRQLRAVRGELVTETRGAWQRIGHLYKAWGQPARAAPFLSTAPSDLDAVLESLP